MFDSQRFSADGFAIVKPFLSSPEVEALIGEVESSTRNSSRRGGTRDIADVSPQIAALAEHRVVRQLVEDILGKNSFVVRATFFDKTETSNWKVPWHQDVTIAVACRADVPDYGPWSTKADVLHVQPPASVLQRMVTVRIHLDACPAFNGALRVMPGSHVLGKLNQNLVEPHVREGDAVICEVDAGGALVMRPLLLHASSPAQEPLHRRVVHFDFAKGELDGGLQWRMH